ncbi:MAG: hypothetical protein KDK36_00055 [Leptospiraceae bacterium]|nr:hypothetical protein [Leptospiraceae bacterium]
MKFLFIIILLITNPNFADSNEANESKILYNKILNTKGLFAKQKLGNSLGKLGINSEAYIIKLFKDDNYWNRSAGVFASKEIDSININSSLINLYLDDHMTRWDSKKILLKEFSKYEIYIIQKWEKETSLKKKKLILDVLENSNSKKIYSILKEEILNKSSKLRKDSYTTLAKIKNKDNDEFLRSYINDPILKTHCLEYIVEKGNKNDKELLKEIIYNDKASSKERVISLSGIKKWGSFNEKKEIFETCLKSKDQSLIFYSINLLGEIRSGTIQNSLCNHSKNNKLQDIRILSAENLIPYQDPSNIKCIKRISEEKYIRKSSKTTTGDVIVGIMSFGLSSIFKSINNNRKRNKFYSRQKKIKEHIKFLESMNE